MNTNRRFRVLAFLLEKGDRISIGFGGKIVIGTSEFPASYQITIPKFARKLLKINKGESIGNLLSRTKIRLFKLE